MTEPSWARVAELGSARALRFGGWLAHRLGPRSGRLTAHIDNVGALVPHGEPTGNGYITAGELTTIGE